jgi:hypothetical protein
VSWPWIALLAVAVGLVAATQWPWLERALGADARRQREREKRKAKLTVVRAEDDFAASVQRDLDSLPTTDEPRTKL